MKLNSKIVGIGVLYCFLAAFSAKADLLGVGPAFPQISYASFDPNSISYDPDTQTFALTSNPAGIRFVVTEDSVLLSSNATLQIQIQLNPDGSLASGTGGFTLTGQFDRVVGGMTNTYSGTLLQGDVVAFGSFATGFSSLFDFRINLTGGSAMSFFTCGDDFAVSLISEVSSFNGSFTNSFNGISKGTAGPEDSTPPSVTCPLPSQVVFTPATNDGVSGFVITYPDPVVTDNCDGAPIVFSDTPSGTFLTVNPGDIVTVNIFAIDISGNLGTCSFTLFVPQQTGGGQCPIVFNDGGCGLVTLTNDPGKCGAAYTFPAPVATNCSGQIFVASATAVDQSGAGIALTNIGNGTYQGVFPHTTTGTNIITFTSNDGQGNTSVRQCPVLVIDGQAPTLMCKNQTGTFKPIMTNALSCIEADFDDVCITSNNYIWFTSTIQVPSFRNAGSFTVHIFDQTIQLMVDNTNVTLNVPDAFVIFSNGVPTATTVFTNGVWVTVARPGLSGNIFAAGLQWQVPFNLDCRSGNMWGRDRDNGHMNYRRHVNSATWCARFAVDNPNVVVQWQWGAVVHSNMTNDCTCSASNRVMMTTAVVSGIPTRPAPARISNRS